MIVSYDIQSGQIIIIHTPEMLDHFGMIPLINYDYSEGEQWGCDEIHPDILFTAYTIHILCMSYPCIIHRLSMYYP